MQRLQGKWVVLVGQEPIRHPDDEGWIRGQAVDLVAARPAGLVVAANVGAMTAAFLMEARRGAPAASLPIVATAFSRTVFAPRVARCVTEWVDYQHPGSATAQAEALHVLDGHAVGVARAKGPAGILALTREDDLRERLCRPMVLSWNLMVVVRKLVSAPVQEMPF